MAVRALLSTLRIPPQPPLLLLLLSRMMSSPAPCGGVLPRHKQRLRSRAHHITVSLDRGEGWLLEAAPVHRATQNTTRSRRACTLGATRRHAHHAVSVPTSSTPGLLMSCIRAVNQSISIVEQLPPNALACVQAPFILRVLLARTRGPAPRLRIPTTAPHALLANGSGSVPDWHLLLQSPTLEGTL